MNLYTFRCPDPTCQSPGDPKSRCQGHEGPLGGTRYEPERVPVLVSGAYTLEQVRAGLLSDGAVRAGTTAGVALPDDGSEDFDRVTRVVLEAALDHFTQLPAGVGADLFPRSSSDARAVRENPGVSADSDREFDEATQELAVELIDARREADGADARLCLLGVEAIAALREFDDHGDYEAPIGVLRRFIESAGSDGNQQPQGGIYNFREQDALEGAAEGIAYLWEAGVREWSELLTALRNDGWTLTQRVAEGDSVQCGGVALARLREQALEMRELVGRAAFFDRHPEWPEREWDRLDEAERGTFEGNAMAAVEAVFDALTQQQSSGGQEGGVTKRVLDRAEELIAEGKLPDEREGEVEEGAPTVAEALLAIKERWPGGLPYQEIANRSGISKAHLLRLMRGEGNPSIRTLARVASALDHDLSFRLTPFTQPISDYKSGEGSG